MGAIATILMILGVVALPVAIIMFIISLVKKKSKIIPLIIFAAGILLFVIGGFMQPSEPANDANDVDEVVTETDSVAKIIKNGVLQYPASNENFKYNIYDTYIEITEYIGSQSAESITVPATIEDLPVYVVDTNVFSKCEVPTIIFEEGIYEINSDFSPTVESVTLPSTLNYVGYSQFKNCYSLVNIVIPEGIDSIQPHAFEQCNSLKEVTIPSTVKSLDDGLFAYCEKLETVNLSSGLITIGEEVFVECKALKSITIPDTVEEIGFYAFQGTGLESVEIPENVATIGANAFLACESLKEVKVYNSDVTIKPYTYYQDGVDMGTSTGLFGQCNEDLVVYGKPASAIANVCAEENVYFKPF